MYGFVNFCCPISTFVAHLNNKRKAVNWTRTRFAARLCLHSNFIVCTFNLSSSHQNKNTNLKRKAKIEKKKTKNKNRPHCAVLNYCVSRGHHSTMKCTHISSRCFCVTCPAGPFAPVNHQLLVFCSAQALSLWIMYVSVQRSTTACSTYIRGWICCVMHIIIY